MRYFPECNYKTALRHFRDEITKTRGLLEALTEIGYQPSQRTLTLRQMKVIEEFLGEPSRTENGRTHPAPPCEGGRGEHGKTEPKVDARRG